MHVLEEFERKQNEYQALALFQRDLEIPLGESCIILKEEHDQNFTKTTNEGSGASISWMVDYCKELVHNSTLLFHPHLVGMKIR